MAPILSDTHVSNASAAKPPSIRPDACQGALKVHVSKDMKFNAAHFIAYQVRIAVVT